MKYDGLVCKNWKCKLYWKLEKGWVLRTGQDRWSIKQVQVNGFYNKYPRLWLQKQFAEKKREILIRDNYTCQHCGYSLDACFVWKNGRLEVHHIISAKEEMALYLDDTNLVTLCEKCHTTLHSFDKRTCFQKKELIE